MLPQLSASLPGRKAELFAGLRRHASSEIGGGQGKRRWNYVHISAAESISEQV